MQLLRKRKHRAQLPIEFAQAGSIRQALQIGLVNICDIEVTALVVSDGRKIYHFNVCGAVFWELMGEEFTVKDFESAATNILSTEYIFDTKLFIDKLLADGLIETWTPGS